ncbi:prolyl oligopeptidase family serine peptidase [Myroides sp. M-43]|uniref:alpha/beta hydrolase family protein n=1 Tax=Myroides oncorhynchi TaxID=2893756 RepID=UPI001E5A2D3D|nr:prolyl oligopeptidase family serine peptidase [Myroides oncorhynchi]MCC9043580.1 prolyl oligopeptidase family serine peptidase [Myroides oncorhynchi]
MKTKKSYILILLSFFILNIKALAQDPSTSTQQPFLWYSTIPYTLSKDKKWLFVNRFYNDASIDIDFFFINTQTKQVRDFKSKTINITNLLDNNIIVYKENDKLLFNDLDNTNNNTYVKNIIRYATISSKNMVITVDQSNNLNLIQVDKNLTKNKIKVFQKVKNHIVSSNGKNIIYSDNNNDLYYINTTTLVAKKLTHLKQDLNSILAWNKQQTAFVIKDQDNTLLLIDLDSNQTKTIALEQGNLKKFKVEFFTNNDLYIEYNTLSSTSLPESEFLDIWNGNTKYIYPSNFKLKHQIQYKAFVYNNLSAHLKQLDRHRNKLYLNIGIPNYILTYNPFEHEEYQSTNKIRQFSLLNLQNNEIETVLSLTSREGLLSVSKDNKHILYPTTTYNIWNIYSLGSKRSISLNTSSSSVTNTSPRWSEDSKKIYFQQNNDFVRFNIDNHKIDKLTNLKTNNNTINIVGAYNFRENGIYFDDSKPVLFTNSSPNLTEFFSLKGASVKKLYSSKNLIKVHDNSVYSNNYMAAIFTEENSNQPPSIKTIIDNRTNTLYQDSIASELYNWRKITKFDFNDKFGETLNGFLTYPKDFDSKKQYPMIIEVYDNFGNLDKHFINPETKNDARINSTFFNEKGYFVCKLNTYVSKEGPGLSAADITLKGLDKVLSIEPSINKDKVALVGFSFGGYKSGFIATQTNRFTTIVSGAGGHDLISNTYSFDKFKKVPRWGMSENVQMQLRDSYSDNPNKYHNNSTLQHAHNIKTPMLLYTGLEDQAVDADNTEKLFLALLKYKKPVIALFYKNVDHVISLSQTTESQDFEKRLLDWFEYHLKDNKTIKWISDGLTPNKHTYSRLEDL